MLWQAFNGRYFSEENYTELMHTVFLSEPVLFKQLSAAAVEQLRLSQASLVDEELMLLALFSQRHPDTHFDRLPSCPLCLEKLDTTVTGL